MGNMLPSDEDDLDEDDLEAISCFTGIIPSANGVSRGKGMSFFPLVEVNSPSIEQTRVTNVFTTCRTLTTSWAVNLPFPTIH